MNIHTQIQNLLSGYVLNELETVDKQTVESHVADCDQCRTELQCMQSVLSIADTIAAAQSTDTQQANAVNQLQNCIERSDSGRSPLRKLFTSKALVATAALLIIGLLISLVFMTWNPGDEKPIAGQDPKQQEIQKPLDLTPNEPVVAVNENQQKINAELARAEALFNAGDAKGLALLFETGTDQAKLAVVNYLSELNPDQLKKLDISRSDKAVIKAVNQAIDQTTIDKQPNPQKNLATDPNQSKADQADEKDIAVEDDPANSQDGPLVEDIDNDDDGFLGIKVVDAKTGKPISGALAKFNHDTNKSKKEELSTNEAGRILFERLEGKTSYLRVLVYANGYIPKHVEWRPDSKGIPVPKQHLVKMDKSVPIGGVVRTQSGQPIEGATVHISTDYATQFTEFNYVQEDVKTDKDGRWYYADFDPEPTEHYLSVKHSDYVSVERYSSSPSIEQLMSLSCVLLMQKGVTIAGIVTDADGAPVKDATIYMGTSRYGSDPKTQTNAEGFYSFENCDKGQTVLTVHAKGYAQDMKTIMATEDVPDADFVLEPGKTLTVRVIDTDQNPVEGVTIEGRYWRTYNRSQKAETIRCKDNTDADGIAILVDLPADEVGYSIRKSGFASMDKYPLTASDQGVTVTLWPKGALVGKVYDAETKERVNEFRMTEGIQWQGQDSPTWQSHSGKQITNGQYKQPFNYHTEGYAVKIEAESYYPYETETYYNEGKEVIRDIYLSRGQGLTGIVYDPDGKPLAGADVGVCHKDGWLHIYNGRLKKLNDEHIQTKTNEQGRFKLAPQSGQFIIIAMHEKGYAQLTADQFNENSEIYLNQWGRIEGTVYTGRNPAINQEIAIETQQDQGRRNAYNIREQTRVFSDDQGRFVYKRVIPGQVLVHKMVPLNNRSKRYTNRTQVEVAPGQTVTVHLGGGGRTVIGTFTNTTSNKLDYSDNNFDIVVVQEDSGEPAVIDYSSLPEIPIPEDLFTRTPEQMQAWQTEWMQTPDGQEFMQKVQEMAGSQVETIRKSYAVVIDGKGNFKIEDVEPGHYKVTGTFRDPQLQDMEGYYQSSLGQVECEMIVDDPDDPNEFENPVDLGSIPVKTASTLKIGQTAPDFQLKDIEGESIRLRDFRNDYVLIDLRGPMYFTGQANDRIDALREVYAAFNESGKLSILTCVTGGSYPQGWTSVRRALTYFLNEKGIEWTLAMEDVGFASRSTIMKSYTVNGQSPSFILIGPNGRLLETIDKSQDLMEIVQKYVQPEEAEETLTAPAD